MKTSYTNERDVTPIRPPLIWLSADEPEAREHARQLVDGHDVELWQLDRKIAAFRHNEKK